jgi:hypothetical protein
VNWQGATVCARCNASLAESYSTGRNPFENESKSESGFSIGKIVAIVVVLGIVGFAAYQFTKPEPPQKAAANAEKQIVVNSAELQKGINEAQKAQAERDAKIQDEIRQTKIEPMKFDKELMQKSAEQHLRNR